MSKGKKEKFYHEHLQKTIDLLQKKVNLLEEENKRLKQKLCQSQST